jgi:hypothetical protein
MPRFAGHTENPQHLGTADQTHKEGKPSTIGCLLLVGNLLLQSRIENHRSRQIDPEKDTRLLTRGDLELRIILGL